MGYSVAHFLKCTLHWAAPSETNRQLKAHLLPNFPSTLTPNGGFPPSHSTTPQGLWSQNLFETFSIKNGHDNRYLYQRKCLVYVCLMNADVSVFVNNQRNTPQTLQVSLSMLKRFMTTNKKTLTSSAGYMLRAKRSRNIFRMILKD